MWAQVERIWARGEVYEQAPRAEDQRDQRDVVVVEPALVHVARLQGEVHQLVGEEHDLELQCLPQVARAATEAA